MGRRARPRGVSFVVSLVYPEVLWLARHLPPTIHPMILHFPIVLLYLTSAISVADLAVRDRDRFLQRSGFWSLTLACGAIVVTMTAGLLSEQWVHWTPATRAILSQHQHWAILTGLSAGAAWLLRVSARFRDRRPWSALGSGRGRNTGLATVLVLIATICVTVTAHLGGRMVYTHGIGVNGVTRRRHPPG